MIFFLFPLLVIDVLFFYRFPCLFSKKLWVDRNQFRVKHLVSYFLIAFFICLDIWLWGSSLKQLNFSLTLATVVELCFYLVIGLPPCDHITYSWFAFQDKGLRELASNALSVLVKYDPEYSANFILEKLIPCTLSSDLCMRHGATLATGELVLALHKCSYALSTGSNYYSLF